MGFTMAHSFLPQTGPARPMIESAAKLQRARFYLRAHHTANKGQTLKLHLANLGDTKMFTAHDAHHVMVNRVTYDHSIVVSATEVREDWPVTDFDALNESHFNYFLHDHPEVILVGTGATQRFAHPKLYRALTDLGVGVEFMDTPAACRTYNILVAEDRKVVAAVLL